MNRTTLSLIAAVTALAAVTGFATVSGGGGDDTPAKAAAQLPVERSSLLCPAPSQSDLAETAYTSYTPKSAQAGSGSGKAQLMPAETGASDSGDSKGKSKKAKAVVTPQTPGKPAAGDASGADAPALVGTADGALAPGWTVQQTTTVDVGSGRGLLGVDCSAPDTDFYFPGASTAEDRNDYIHLTNPDDEAAVVDVQLYGPDGAIKSDVGEGIQIAPHASVPVLLSTLTDKPYTNLTLHVTARSGRVAAAVSSADAKLGGDWLPAAADPAASLVLPGIPKDATSVRLVAFAPGQDDADLKVQLATSSGKIVPAGHDTLHVKSGMTTAVDLGAVTRGDAGSLVLTPSEDAVPIVAALRVTRGKGADQETAFIPATRDIGARATVADNRSKGSTLALTAPGATGKVKVTASAGTEGGTAVTKEYTVKGGTTLSVTPPVPSGLKGSYALTVEPVSGGKVYGSRMLDEKMDGVPAFTIQTLPDDRGTVSVPQADEDLAVVQK
ncbi:DUF5719 family protein [Streptomyces sp. VRA16 Mangrove soil]|uniref:DUF5719 family protein n=1 Tax=Streptomyces sp. VRA16 Mangrove soil TaxID=2817434 RepID=UPI001A9FEDA8|nr:DUF5719 family protein [Streptomyces sp. VRA16 Mangrove soil]MBO1338062.1 hypothetical protein [Streptomyces sp. VRA16 Mangrove soil]